MAGGTATTGSKATTKAKTTVPVKTSFFVFTDHTGKALGADAEPIDLKAGSLKIKQINAFIPPAGADGQAADEADAYLTLWELKGESNEKDHYEFLRIYGKVKKDDGYNFRPEVGKAFRFVQDDGGKYFFKQAEWAAGKKTPHLLKLKIEITALDEAKSEMEVVFPPLEFDETWELQLGGGMVVADKLEFHKNFAIGRCKARYSDWKTDSGLTVTEDMTGIVTDGAQRGNLEKIVIHCMCAIYADADPANAFDSAKNAQILRDGGYSAHFILNRDGSLRQCARIDRMGRHAPGSNTRSVGIELLGFHDQVRDETQKKYENNMKPLQTLKDKRKVIADKLAEHEAAKAAGKAKVIVGGKEMDVDEAITRCREAVAELDKQIADWKPDDWTRKYGENILEPKDADGVPLAFKYTAAQYETLRKMMAAFARRYGYKIVWSHHKIDPTRKFDPGKYFDWGQITGTLLPGNLQGDEASGGGKYTVEI